LRDFLPKKSLMRLPRINIRKGKVLVTSLAYGFFSLLIAYCCVSAIAGKAGVLAYQDLLIQKQEIQKAIDYLQAQNLQKSRAIEDLKNNSVVAAEGAAVLGYVRQGEMLIVLPDSWRASVKDGEGELRLPVVMGDSTGLPDAIIRFMAAITGLFALLAIQLFHFNPEAKERKHISLERQG